jgi:hypothetical protein
MFASSLMYNVPAMCDISTLYDLAPALQYVISDITLYDRQLTRPPLIVYQGGTNPSGNPVRHPVVFTMVDPPGPGVSNIRKSKYRCLDYSDDHSPREEGTERKQPPQDSNMIKPVDPPVFIFNPG